MSTAVLAKATHLHRRLRTTVAAPSPNADPGAELALPALQWRAWARRLVIPGVVAAGVVAVVVLRSPGTGAVLPALRRALHANPLWALPAIGFEAASLGGYIALLWLVGSRESARVDARAAGQITLAGAASTRLLPTGGMGGIALALWALRRTGLGATGAVRTLLTFLVVLYGVFFAAIAVSGALLALGLGGAAGPRGLELACAVAGALVIATALGAARHHPGVDLPAAPAGPGRLRTLRQAPAVLGVAVRRAVALVGTGDPRLLGALAYWALDAAVLWTMLHAVGLAVSPAAVVLAYGLGQVANTIPLPGSVSGGLAGALLAFGLPAAPTLTAVLAYRALAVWLPVPLGALAITQLRATVTRWGHTTPTTLASPTARRPATSGAASPHAAPTAEDGQSRRPDRCRPTGAGDHKRTCPSTRHRTGSTSCTSPCACSSAPRTSPPSPARPSS